jgi:hypothetical protein
MKTWERLLAKLIAGVITYFAIYQLIGSLRFMDFASSVEPGWHTTIFPERSRLSLTTILVICTIFTWFLYKCVLKLVVYVWLKIFR